MVEKEDNGKKEEIIITFPNFWKLGCRIVTGHVTDDRTKL